MSDCIKIIVNNLPKDENPPIINEKDAKLFYIRNFIEDDDDFIQQLMSLEKYTIVSYWQSTMFQRQKVYPSPRRVSWFTSNPKWSYNFGRYTQLEPLPAFNINNYPFLSNLRDMIQSFTGKPYNSVLINIYETGDKNIAAHSDDDPWLGDNFDVPSISLGATREMIFRKKKDKNREIRIDLESGSLAIMSGKNFQKDWTHELPKKSKTIGLRINLTFRNVFGNLLDAQRANFPLKNRDELYPSELDIFMNDVNWKEHTKLAERSWMS